LFGDPGRSITDQVLKAYEYRDKWVNRMILGDSLAVMNSLLRYEGLGGQVQMIYIDPPYGVNFGSRSSRASNRRSRRLEPVGATREFQDRKVPSPVWSEPRTLGPES
jgi:DNA modification methylase